MNSKGKRKKNQQEGPNAAQIPKALNHPLRRRIMRRLDGDSVVRSPRLLADEMDIRLSGVSYHMRILAKYRMVQLDDERSRGSRMHFYRSNVNGDEHVRHFLRATEAQDGPLRGEGQGEADGQDAVA